MAHPISPLPYSYKSQSMQPINNLPIALPGPGMQSHVVYITIYHHRLNRLDFEDCIVLVVVVAAVVSLVKDLYYT